MAKTLMVVCGTGIATSTVATGKIKDYLDQEGIASSVQFLQSKIADEVNRIDDYDIVVSTSMVPTSIKDKVINGVPLLTGIGAEKVYKQIKEKILA